ncbi:MAG: UDP-N-acetylglucosamine diphosphorylase/glucosamine-1-phosphate N-acetyltransferase [Bdellovibrionales bacterium]|nr:UDP-N-acetylglucosamine diphosphorylase/glucosamine-1-phosphate N-acetyltransferase [Bdellovibrionales bacterium]
MSKIDYSKISVIILAAGKGTRMKSNLPKVLHPVAGLPILYRTLTQIKSLGVKDVRVVVGHGQKLVEPLVNNFRAKVCIQKELNGTAGAVMSADLNSAQDNIIILNGDHPFIRAKELDDLIKKHINQNSEFSVITSVVKYPGDRGRMLYFENKPKAIIEAKDASIETLKIKEVNTGMYITKLNLLKKFLPKLTTHANSKELYFTEVLSLAVESDCKVSFLKASNDLAFGVNSQEDLAIATGMAFKNKNKILMSKGVVILNPKTTFIEELVEVGPGTVIYPGAHLKGKTAIGCFCVLEPNVFINSSCVENSVQIKMGSYIESSVLKEKAVVGPYAHLRPESHIGKSAKIGNFVETKKAIIGDGVKASHLSYLGDVTIGANTNIGCGVVTCNYTLNKTKEKTIIGSNVFVGSNTQLIAPVELKNKSCTAAGSVINKDVPEKALAVARAKQINKENFKKD